MRKIWAAAICGALVSSVAPVSAKAPTSSATITRTKFGIPHIRATSWEGIGLGAGYAYAQDNLCMIAEEFATVRGERSKFFGPRKTATLGFSEVDNLSSDLFFRSVIDLPQLRVELAKRSPDVRALVHGYIAGYNRWLRDIGPSGVPAECRGQPWVRPIGTDDYLRLFEKEMLLASSLALAPFIANAQPPSDAKTSSNALDRDPFVHGDIGFGSNGWAFGSQVTSGSGILVGNPHFPWNGPARFWQMHLTIPGKLDVMGVSIAGGAMVSLGFNKDVAWTHTVTAAQHFTVFELKLDPANPLAYQVDGKTEAMRPISVTVPMPAGEAPVTRTLYTTRYGPVLASPFIGMTWTRAKAFAIRDANHNNMRSIEAWIAIDQARNVGDIKRAVSTTLGIPWVNTIATDRTGAVLHADVTAVPNVSAAKLATCGSPLNAKLAGRLFVLDGSRSACDWDMAAGTPVPGLMPASDQAIWERRDYVANSNDSYWLSNASAPYRQLSPILGAWGTERTLRTRSGLLEIERRLTGQDGMPGTKVTQLTAEAMAFANKSLGAELLVDPVLKMCAGQAALVATCDALGKWDRRFNLDSRGAYLFLAFFEALKATPAIWATPFDPADPAHTPRDLKTDAATTAQMLGALGAARDRLAKEGIALDARWGDVQFAVRGSEHIPIHGGSGALGVLNVQQSKPVPGGIVPFHGTSYIQVVTFDAKGPVADALLSYSEATDPASPHWADQTRAFSAKQWHRLPFTPAEIAAEGGTTITVRP
ncbi:penicillin acylase family protein [Sphingomonas sp. GlSt437]|uniref:penicillin acylase family protein n=1 Tax=Sphingomonas sp. GlSt437 TaxID=3389970 RepID=UPI003A87E355